MSKFAITQRMIRTHLVSAIEQTPALLGNLPELKKIARAFASTQPCIEQRHIIPATNGRLLIQAGRDFREKMGIVRNQSKKKPKRSNPVPAAIVSIDVKLLKSMPYEEYLQTPQWKAKRDKKLWQARYKCQLCNSEKKLDVHHRTYERRGNEDLEDLTVLCRNCHAIFHGKTA